MWDESILSNISEQSDYKREVFESNLEKEGLQIEYVDTPGVALHFVKLHAPDEVLRRYAEILKLRMPMKKVHKINLKLYLLLNNLNLCFRWNKM